MKLSNIRNFKRFGNDPRDWKFTADVDVTTGFLWWEKTSTKQVAREYACSWFFLDSGKYTPGRQMEVLAKPIQFLNGW